ncbi:uncharacterized protein BP5553_08380 [Venustampulla echinocandica]|uniref:Uncharacterized protein n=1 Tax=Venustampulla echinocandica TaxID=2656787 RepID=A0A370TE42_9HELO|nr:uncharacterized protein BP5553_08380 [Venustampulla echinocandica]RDL32941.1 hypothetical protein BP5553_08380 [Venustampulla echinocandica]
MEIITAFLALSLTVQSSTGSILQNSPANILALKWPSANLAIRTSSIAKSNIDNRFPAANLETLGDLDLSRRSDINRLESIGAQLIRDLGMNMNSSIASPVPSTAMASQAYKTVTGTYALQTISLYSGLRQKITTTITATRTGAQYLTSVETGVAVIIAGGVTWSLACFVGDAATAAKVLEALKDADKHPDDSSCPNPKDKRTDCGGVGSICETGSSTGCTCDEEKAACPEGDAKPNVQMPTACQIVPINDPANNNQYKDCFCMEDLDVLIQPYVAFEDEAEWENYAQAWASLPKLTPASYYHPKTSDAACPPAD